MNRRLARSLLLVLLGAAWARPAGAAPVSLLHGNLTGSFDTTVSAGLTLRTSGREPGHIGLQNGGTAYSINGDDGDLNYDAGDVTSATGKATFELDLRYGNVAYFGRAFAFHDAEIMDWSGQARTPITERAKDEIGQDFKVLDSYGVADFSIGAGATLTVRGGKQVLSWGESTFIQNGINTVNPVDVSKLRVAGAELREGLVPVPLLDAVVRRGNLSVEGFYQLAWDHTEIEPAGTFFSTNDFASPGGENVYLRFGLPTSRGGPSDTADNLGVFPPVGTVVPRGVDRDARDSGQFGAALRLFAPGLGDTEFGLYFTRLHSRLPVVSGTAGTAIGLGNGDFARTARYYREFPEGIETYGLSFNTEVGALGLAVQGEGSYRRNQPLQADDVELLFAALSPVNPVFVQSQLITRQLAFGQDIAGYRRKDLVQAQMTLSKVMGRWLGADQIVTLGEAGFTTVQDMESQSVLRYEGPGTTTSGNPAFTAAGLQPATQTEGFADPFSWGYRLLVRGEYNNALAGVNLRPQVAWAHDVSGITPAPVSNFIEGRKVITLSLDASFLNRYAAGLGYTKSFGAGRQNPLNDRDFLTGSVSVSF